MKSKKLISVMLAGIMAMGLLAGCSSTEKPESTQGAAEKTADAQVESSSGQDVEITVFHRFSDGASKQFFDEVAASFEEEHPGVKVVMTRRTRRGLRWPTWPDIQGGRVIGGQGNCVARRGG